MLGLAVLFGGLVGFSLGLTGGGGGIFAVPLLVYGLSIGPREAVGISLASVGGTAIIGAAPKLMRGEIEWRTGMVFALGGMVGAPVGNFLSRLLPESALLLLFSGLMLVVAQRMWTQAKNPTNDQAKHDHAVTNTVAERGTDRVQMERQHGEDRSVGFCQRDPQGRLQLSSKCLAMLSLLGLATGVLSGMFGVGGGFVVVPALVLFSGMSIHQAVATSLLVIFLVSISGVGSYLISGGSFSLQLTLLFIAGGVLGMQLGTRLSARLSGPSLQKLFSVAILAVAVFVIVKSLGGLGGSPEDASRRPVSMSQLITKLQEQNHVAQVLL